MSILSTTKIDFIPKGGVEYNLKTFDSKSAFLNYIKYNKKQNQVNYLYMHVYMPFLKGQPFVSPEVPPCKRDISKKETH